MRQRLPLVLSATALVVAIFGSTPLGHAVVRAIPPFARAAGYATNAGAVNGIHASRTPKARFLVPLGVDGKFPASVGVAGPPGAPGQQGPAGPAGPAGATNVIVRDGSAAQIAAGGFNAVTASCNGNERATGGGVRSDGADTVVADSYATSGASALEAKSGEAANGWWADVHNEGSTTRNVHAFVICASP